MGAFTFLVVIISFVAILSTVTSFQSLYRRHYLTRRFSDIEGDFKTEDEYSSEATAKAMEAARQCEANGLSPGAGLPTAEEQAEAAYADMINTTMDQKGIALSDEELKELNKGGRMWEKGALTTVNKMGILSDFSNLWKALSGGAHIENR